jgi:hypothetical protein
VCVSLLAAKKTRKKELGELVCRQALERSTAFASGVKGRGREFRDLWPGVQQPWACVQGLWAGSSGLFPSYRLATFPCFLVHKRPSQIFIFFSFCDFLGLFLFLFFGVLFFFLLGVVCFWGLLKGFS